MLTLALPRFAPPPHFNKILSTTLHDIPTSIAKPSPSATTSAAMAMMAAMLQTTAAGQGASEKTGFGDKDIERAEACFEACQTNFDASVNGYVNMLCDNYVRACSWLQCSLNLGGSFPQILLICRRLFFHISINDIRSTTPLWQSTLTTLPNFAR